MLHVKALALLVCVCTAIPADGDRPEGIRWEDHTGRAWNGDTLHGKLGRLQVPQRRDDPDGAQIDLAFVRYASEAREPAPPVFYLAGGPGASGVIHCATAATLPEIRLLDVGDVVGIDQRGTGLTRPDLSEGPEFRYELPLDEVVDREDVVAAFGEAMQRCTAFHEERGVDLTAYDTWESAADLEAVRAALGYEKIVLYGESYGSHLALAYLRRYPERVARAVLVKVEGPDQTWKLPSAVQAALERVHELAAADPAVRAKLPDLLGAVRALLAELEAEPKVVRPSRGPTDLEITVGPYDLQVALSQALSGTNSIATLPKVLYLLGEGHWSLLASVAYRNRNGAVESPMAVAMDCASGASAERRARIAREAADPRNLLGDAIDPPYVPAACDACGAPDLGDAFRAPLVCDVPVLFVSGSLDARTPPSNVEEIEKGFPNHVHLLVENTAHDSRELQSEEYQRLLRSFLRGEKVESRTIPLPPVAFAPVEAR